MGDAVTRDFLRSELRSLLEEIEERGLTAQRRDEDDSPRESGGSSPEYQAT
jgi:hypothetical protein